MKYKYHSHKKLISYHSTCARMKADMQTCLREQNWEAAQKLCFWTQIFHVFLHCFLGDFWQKLCEKISNQRNLPAQNKLLLESLVEGFVTDILPVSLQTSGSNIPGTEVQARQSWKKPPLPPSHIVENFWNLWNIFLKKITHFCRIFVLSYTLWLWNI